MRNDETINPFKEWKKQNCDKVGSRYLMKSNPSGRPMTNEELFARYKTTLETKTKLLDEDALHIGKEIFAWGHLSDESIIYQVKETFLTVVFYRQTNISGDRWKRAFDYLCDKRYVLPFETISAEELREQHQLKIKNKEA